jgi:hypothetical protein
VAREIVSTVTFAEFYWNTSAVLTEALREIIEQFVSYYCVNAGAEPHYPLPAADLAKTLYLSQLTSSLRQASMSRRKVETESAKSSNGSRSKRNAKDDMPDLQGRSMAMWWSLSNARDIEG